MADVFSTAERSRIMAAVKAIDTTPELIVRRLIHSLGFRYRLHVRALPGCPDLVFPARRKIIDVRGCFWHMHHCGSCRVPRSRRAYWTAKLERNRDRDVINLRKLRRAGWSVLIVWECQTQSKDLDVLRSRVSRFLEKPKQASR